MPCVLRDGVPRLLRWADHPAPSVCCLTANRHDRREGLRYLGIRLRVDLRPYPLPSVRGFGMFAFCSPCPYAARCPVAVVSGDDELIPELSSPGMLMKDGCHWRPEHTLSSDGIDSRLMLIRPPVPVPAD